MTQQLITMTSKELSRYGVVQNLIEKRIDGTQAAKQLSLSVRHLKRIKARVIKEGQRGIIHKNRDRDSNRKIQEEIIEKIEKIIKKKYYDFGPTFAAEKLEENHQIKIGDEKLRQLMTEWGLWKPKQRKKNKEYRRWRERKEYCGEMEQFDGSYHKWFESRAPECCLLASIDDADGKITKLKFGSSEGVKPVFSFWREYIEEQGKPLNIYLDRHSTYKQNHKSVFDDPDCLTQFQRAMKTDLRVNIIHAYSPQGKGRIERLFNTLQDRLVKEFRLHNISNIEQANAFVEKKFIPKFNQKFSVIPQKKRNLHKPLNRIEKQNLDKIFSILDTRVVNNDFTVRYQKKWFQLLETQPCLVQRRERIQIEQRMDDSIFISLRNRYLDYKELPCRPEKINMPVVVLTRTKPSWKPPVNHLWRKPFIVNPEKARQTSSLPNRVS